MRNLTFGDIQDTGTEMSIRLRKDEAGLIVVDMRIANDPAAISAGENPFVCAVAGPQEEVEKIRDQYTNNEKYFVQFWPAEEQ